MPSSPKSPNGNFGVTSVVPEPPEPELDSRDIEPPGKVCDAPLMPFDGDRGYAEKSSPTAVHIESQDKDRLLRIHGQHGSDPAPPEQSPSIAIQAAPDQLLHRKNSAEENTGDDGGKGHEKPESIINALASGVINYLLMFGLCCAFGMILFEKEWDAQHRALGVKLNLLTSLILGLLLAWKSKICVAIGGPDLTPVVFLGSFVNLIAEDIALQLDLEYPEGANVRRLMDHDRFDYSTELLRKLGSGGSATPDAEFCQGAHLTENSAACEEYHEQLIATVIFAIMASSFSLGLIFFSLGRFRVTRYVSYVPTSIMEAFLSCVGYKVFKYALTFCRNEPKQFIPAACVGVPLYFVKAMHLGNPALVIPTMLFVPLIGFYIWIFAIQGSDLHQARQDQLMFPEMDNVEFWNLWGHGFYGSMSKINTKAWAKTVPDLIMMIVVCVLDCLLKLSSTETKLPITVDKDYEIQLHGLGNFMTTLSGGSVGYMQLKFNVVNYGVLGNIKDRRGGAIYALLCGVGFFGTMAHINYLPRFFLGILLFFAGAGFVAENLWGSRKYLSFHEWMQIFVILAVFIFSGKLLYAVLAGGLLTGMDFIVRYARVPCTSGDPLRGGELVSKERHGPILQRNLQHLANSWLLVIKLKGFVFFASAQRLTKYVREEIFKQASVPPYRRLKYIAFDCQLLDGMDASASKAMKKLVLEARQEKIRILWSHVTEKFVEELKSRKILNGDWNAFNNLDEVKSYVEDRAHSYLTSIHQRWINLHPAFQLRHELMRMQHAFEPFDHVFVVDAVRRGCPWQYCGAVQMHAYETQLWQPGEKNQDLFLVHSGAVGLFKDALDDESREHRMPEAIYRHGWFLNTNALMRAPTRNHAIAIQDGEVLFWNEQQWSKMQRECPFMVSAMSKLVMKQQVMDTDLDSKVTPVHDLPPFDLDAIQDAGEETARRDESILARARTSRLSKASQHSSDALGEKKLSKGATAPMETSLERVNSGSSAMGNLPGGIRRTLQSMMQPGSARTSHRASHQQDAPMMQPEVSETVSTVLKGSRRPSTVNGVLGNVLPWLADDGGTEVSRFKEVGSAASLTIPEQLQVRLEGIQLAQVLDKFRLYESISDSKNLTLPGLPRSFKMDLDIAFYTFASVDSMSGIPTVDATMLPQALMYAGIFNTIIKPKCIRDEKDKERDAKLNIHEFLQVGHEAVMAALSRDQEAKIEKIFKKFDYDGSGDFNREEMVGMFRQMFHPDISIEEVDGICNAWDDRCSGMINLDSFRAIMSHLIREHEQDWVLLRGMKDLMGITGEIRNEMRVSAEALARNCQCEPKITQEEAEELLWAADWRQHGIGGGQSLEFPDVIAAVVLDLNLPKGCALPPRPKVPETARRKTVVRNQVGQLPLQTLPSARDCITETKVMTAKERSLAVHSKHILDIRDRNIEFPVMVETMKEASADLCRSNPRCERSSNLIVRHEPKAVPILSQAQHNHHCAILKGDNQDEEVGIRAKIFLFIEEPKSSLAANYFSLAMGLMIIVSVLTLVLEPLINAEKRTETEDAVWRGFEIYFTALFTLELLIRFAVSNSMGTQTFAGFARTPGNICDFVAIIPFFVEVAVGQKEDEFRLLRIARLMRLSRVIKIAKLANRSSLFGPVAMVLTVIWGIYLKNADSGK